MERELWLALYKLARNCAPPRWWETVVFFRFRGRGRVLVGRAARATDGLGVQTEQLAEGLVAR
jgi:hypothetical protein